MTTTHRAATTSLLVLSLAAASAPTAGARPADFTPAARHAPTAVYSRPDKSLIPASQTATSAAADRAALVRSSVQQERQRVAGLSAYRAGQLAIASDVAAPAANEASAPQAIVRVQPPQSGFDWGDAGIGAAGGLALAMLGLGGGLIISRQRPRQTRPTAGLPS